MIFLRKIIVKLKFTGSQLSKTILPVFVPLGGIDCAFDMLSVNAVLAEVHCCCQKFTYGLDVLRTVARKFSIGGLCVCARGA